MNKEPSEVDLIIHHMRQSKLDSVRALLEEHKKKTGWVARPYDAKHSREFLDAMLLLFKTASNNAPLP